MHLKRQHLITETIIATVARRGAMELSKARNGGTNKVTRDELTIVAVTAPSFYMSVRCSRLLKHVRNVNNRSSGGLVHIPALYRDLMRGSEQVTLFNQSLIYTYSDLVAIASK